MYIESLCQKANLCPQISYITRACALPARGTSVVRCVNGVFCIHRGFVRLNNVQNVHLYCMAAHKTPGTLVGLVKHTIVSSPTTPLASC